MQQASSGLAQDQLNYSNVLLIEVPLLRETEHEQEIPELLLRLESPKTVLIRDQVSELNETSSYQAVAEQSFEHVQMPRIGQASVDEISREHAGFLSASLLYLKQASCGLTQDHLIYSNVLNIANCYISQKTA